MEIGYIGPFSLQESSILKRERRREYMCLVLMPQKTLIFKVYVY